MKVLRLAACGLLLLGAAGPGAAQEMEHEGMGHGDMDSQVRLVHDEGAKEFVPRLLYWQVSSTTIISNISCQWRRLWNLCTRQRWSTTMLLISL